MGHKVPGDGEGFDYLLTTRTKNHTLPGQYEESDNAGVESHDHKWCTMECEFADWPQENVDGAKSCRTFSALWCKSLEQHVTKNTPCTVEHGARRPKPIW